MKKISAAKVKLPSAVSLHLIYPKVVTRDISFRLTRPQARLLLAQLAALLTIDGEEQFLLTCKPGPRLLVSRYRKVKP